MNFLVIIGGLVLLYWPRFFSAIQDDRWFNLGQAKVSAIKSLQVTPFVGMIVMLGLPVLAIACLLELLEGVAFGLPYLLINICVLLYAFGRGDSREQVDELVNDLNRGDMQAAFHDIAVFTIDVREGEAMDLATFSEELKARLAYSYFERHLAVLFWFMIAGAPLALLYRLSVLYRQNSSHSDFAAKTGQRETGQREAGQRWLWIMEWLPLRVVGLTLALVGHFNSALQRWREQLFSRQTSQRTLLAIVNAALDGLSEEDRPELGLADEPGVLASQVVRGVERLFFNTIVCWLVVIALAIVLA